MKRRAFGSGLSIFVVSVFFCASCTSSPTAGKDPNALRIGYSAWPGWLPLTVAEEQQKFAANNAGINLQWFDGYLDSLNTLAAGQLDANTLSLQDTINAVAAGADLVAVVVTDYSTGNDQIIVSEGINSVGELKGKTVAAEESTVYFLLRLALEKAGLTLEDIEFQPLEAGASAAAFVAGQVDAVSVYAPFTSKATQRSGSKVIFSSKDVPGAIPSAIVFQRETIENRPEAVQAFVNAWFDTLAFMEYNPETAYEMMAKRAGVSVEEYKEYAAGTNLLSLEENLTAFTPGNDLNSVYYAAEQVSNFLVETGLAQQKPDIDGLFDDRFVKAYAQQREQE
ncbi:aliphatic sulfonate ABC transporter substrate-binding protein [Phormidium sp. CCY1219]|uniref:aliphatic sulfonate ABC transporter substrate-binding protein n=1 Tax=Phormidium sp. CCY1219 TaxID=2886104 RepID=UPI002D1F4083|nr:aliphatic sulfonate ABC transporter substrate-binding protein [Phormidium sp. CCY1219]MEB3826159.1 aliphatic sulfonate ABC transporter substrate-binding protein [Phormidium sp. CCY1219]